MLDDWNGDGKIDGKDQMLQDEFDDWVLSQYRKRNGSDESDEWEDDSASLWNAAQSSSSSYGLNA